MNAQNSLRVTSLREIDTSGIDTSWRGMALVRYSRFAVPVKSAGSSAVREISSADRIPPGGNADTIFWV
jgi:hypothetical protein